MRAVAAEGYDTPTPVQAAAIPHAARGRDVLGVAQTGTGKTAAFTLPILQQLDADRRRPEPRAPRALILTPTRELAIQIGESMTTYGKYLRLSHTVVYGGVGQNPQVQAMRRGVDTLIATPGRLLDLIDQGWIDLGAVEIFVLDEADRMLDMGFIRDVNKIVSELPPRRQTLFFSATMPQAITKLASELLHDYERIDIKPEATTAEKVSQRVLFVEKANKRELLGDLLDNPALDRAIVFTRTKHGANRVAKFLDQRGIGSDAIHGNKSQGARQRALEGFKEGRTRVLVATDIASRGIDVDDVSHVINFDLPNEPESYVHRIGRTARAGADGAAVSFCDFDEVAYLHAIEHIIRQKVMVDAEHAYHDDRIAARHADGPQRGAQVKSGRPSGGRSSNGRSSGGRSSNGRSSSSGSSSARSSRNGRAAGNGSSRRRR